MVMVCDKDDNVIQIDNLPHILNPFHVAAVILAGLFGNLLSLPSKESKSVDTIITVVFGT